MQVLHALGGREARSRLETERRRLLRRDIVVARSKCTVGDDGDVLLLLHNLESQPMASAAELKDSRIEGDFFPLEGWPLHVICLHRRDHGLNLAVMRSEQCCRRTGSRARPMGDEVKEIGL